jgi:N-methylhydantoinase B/oxoprolinase/acetone carboxylase alpha subunit
MNNLTFGTRTGKYSASDANNSRTGEGASGRHTASAFAYYETLGGGIGAGPDRQGGDGMHAHMSNTRNTPVEALEFDYPVRVCEYRYREDSGGDGFHRGGNGLVRTLEFLVPVTATLVSERRNTGPYGLMGGKPGAAGVNRLIREDETTELPGKVTLVLQPGDKLQVQTPGGGGWGLPDE